MAAPRFAGTFRNYRPRDTDLRIPPVRGEPDNYEAADSWHDQSPSRTWGAG
ncbi:hypothetical protein ASZ90_016685 [hydrocarbon metagenome]|uniref:Uncharacterized protein n=1 Tax=hydrocarbon metagenome TaxID=938273 RepID=A0A0W8EGT8_9ZZZZ